MGIWPNVGDEAALEAAFREVKDHFGGLDIVCNNAGISQSTPLDEYQPNDLDGISTSTSRESSTVAKLPRAYSKPAA
mgnify:CR=1 FL=1